MQGHPRSAPLLLDYVPSYKSFRDALRVRDLRQVVVSVSKPDLSDVSIIVATPPTGRKFAYTVPLQVKPIGPNELGSSSFDPRERVHVPLLPISPLLFFP